MNKTAPRDLFNEASFLKCLALLIRGVAQGQVCNLTYSGLPADLGALFIEDSSSGEWVLDPQLFSRADTGEFLRFSRGLNARDPYPLLVVTEDWEEFEVFNDDGTFNEEFLGAWGGCEQQHNPQALLDAAHLLGRSHFLKGLGKLALDVIPDVAQQLAGFSFDEDRYTQGDWEILEHDGMLSIEPSLLCVLGTPAPVRAPATSSTVDAWPLQMWSASDQAWLDVFQHGKAYSEAFHMVIAMAAAGGSPCGEAELGPS